MKQLKFIKQFFATTVCMLLTLMMMFLFTDMPALAYDGMDVILVVDDTKSMQETDPNKLSSIAINKFVEKLPDSDNMDIRLGITTYSINVMPGSLELGHTRDEIKNFSNTNIKQSGKGTDAAVGINWAVSQFETNSDDTRKKAIILIGDGENSYIVNNQVIRTENKSNNMLNSAISTAQAKDINVYTLAINPIADNFRQYFANIASSTGGIFYEPKIPDDLNGFMDEIVGELTNGIIAPVNTVVLPQGQPVTQDFDVPNGVFEMNLQCEHQSPIEIYFTDPNGTIYNEGSGNVTFSKEVFYTNAKIHEPVAGNWQVTYKSDIQQEIKPQFIFYTDLTILLSKNQNTVMLKNPVEYIATIMTNGKEISNDNSLSGLDAKLVITEIEDQGNAGKTNTEKMLVKNGKFSLEYAIDKSGKYEIHAELVGNNSSIKSNSLTFEVAVDPTLMPLWQKIAIAVGIIILLVALVLLYKKMVMGAGTGLVTGNISIKIVGRKNTTMIFQEDIFNCLDIFLKKNTLSNLIVAYGNRYRINNPGKLDQDSLDEFINSSLKEVSDKISICGNRKKQTIVKIPPGYDMQVNEVDIFRPRVFVFNSPEEEIEMRFNNQGYYYTIKLVFTR